MLDSLDRRMQVVDVFKEKIEEKLLAASVKSKNDSKIDIYEFIAPKDMVLNLRGLKLKNADIPNWDKREKRELGEPDGSDDTTGAYSNMVYYENRFNASDFSNIVNSVIEKEMQNV